MKIVNTLPLESNRQIKINFDGGDLPPMQVIYMIITGYFEDDSSDELTNDPVFKAVLEKDALASQPTVSRFHKLLFWILIPLSLMHMVNRNTVFLYGSS